MINSTSHGIYISEICGSGAISTCPIHGMATAQTTNPQSATAIITIFQMKIMI